MGKKQHSKDRLYLTTKEWKNEYGGFKDRGNIPKSIMPFNYCCISFQPAIDPVCTDDGYVFDLVNVVKYIQKYHRHPITGTKIDIKDLVQLHLHKNSDDQIQCPILNKVFTDYSHIVAIKTTGHVYSYEAIDELCIKPRNYVDLITDESFTRKDIIHLQDPQNMSLKKVATDFDHVKLDLQIDEEQEEEGFESFRHISDNLRQKLQGIQDLKAKNNNQDTREIQTKRLEYKELLQQEKTKDKQNIIAQPQTQSSNTGKSTQNQQIDWRLQPPDRKIQSIPKFKPGASTWDTEDKITQNQIEAQRDDRNQKKNNKFNNRVQITNQQNGKQQNATVSNGIEPAQWYENKVVYKYGTKSTGTAARAFTSTNMNPNTKIELEREQVFFNPTQKSYVRLNTNLGALNIELYSDITPRTCENFIYLCQMGYYDNTIFHRSIKNFMIQGGDPSGTGMGGSSIYGQTFPDEIDSRLTHKEKGVLSMANSGKDTNGSQFFITYKSARHLDYKHTVFGQIVGGFDVLNKMEKVPTNNDDRPNEKIYIQNCEIFQNPYDDMIKEYLAKEKDLQNQKNDNQPQELPTQEKNKNYVDIGRGVKVQQDQTYGNWYSDPGKTYFNIEPQNKSITLNIDDQQNNNESQKSSTGIGKYLKQNQQSQNDQAQQQNHNQKRKINEQVSNDNLDFDIPKFIPKKQNIQTKQNFGNFDKF